MGRHKCLTKAQTEIYNLGIALLKEKYILDDKGPPPDKIYEVLIENRKAFIYPLTKVY